MRRLALIAAAVALASAPAQAQVTNGGFESGLTGWTQTNCPNFSSTSAAAAHSGALGYINGTIGTTCTISQNITTVVGTSYTFSFWLANLSGDTPNSFSASFGGATQFSMSNNAAFAFTQFSSTVVASAASTTIAFNFRHDPSFWTLDDVSVTASTVPEPSSVLLLASGMLGLAVTAARRRRRI